MFKLPEKILSNRMNKFSEIPYDVYFFTPNHFTTKKIYNNIRNIINNNQTYNFYFLTSLEEIFEKIFEEGGIFISNKIFIPGKIIHEEFIINRGSELLAISSKPYNFRNIKYNPKVKYLLFKDFKVEEVNEIITNEVQKFIEGDKKLRNEKQKIPYKIMQTGKTNFVNNRLYENIKQLLKYNTEYDYYFFTDNDCVEFIKREYTQTEVDCFNKIIPGACKADYFRYLYLYKEGGVYLDLDTITLNSFKYLIEPKNEFISVHDGGVFGELRNNNYIYNAIMFVTPGHELMKKAYEICTYNIINKVNLEGALEFTGPGVLGSAFVQLYNENVKVNKYRDEIINIFDFNHKISTTLSYNGIKLFITKDMKQINNFSSYVSQFVTRNVLKS